MSDDDQIDDDPVPADPVPVDASLAALLADPATWSETDASMEDKILTEINADAGSHTDAPPSLTNVIAMSPPRRYAGSIAAGIAAALIILGGFAILASGDDRAEGVELALVGTELAPAATATALLLETPQGTRVELDVTGLAPAAEGEYYEAWLSQEGGGGVSAGTFHLRGGDGAIELWAGVAISDYPLIAVTIQAEAETLSSGRVVLKGGIAP